MSVSISPNSNQIRSVGQSITFTATASGFATNVNWTWFKDGLQLFGQSTNTFTISSANMDSNGVYYARATPTIGQGVNSQSVTLKVVPTITTTKTNLLTNQGLTLTATPATSINSVTQWKWYKTGSSTPLATTTTGTYQVSSATTNNTGTYYVSVIRLGVEYFSSENNNSVTITVYPLPTVTPTSAIRMIGQSNIVLTCNPPTGLTGALTYQWRKDGLSIASATNNTYSVTTNTSSAGNYSVLFNSSTAGTSAVASTNSVVTINPKPNITGSTTATVNSSVTLTCNSTTQGIPTFAWYKGSSAITGATSSTYTYIPSAAGSDVFYVIVSDDNGAATQSDNFTVTVSLPPAPTISTISASYNDKSGLEIDAPVEASVTLSATVSGAASYQWYYKQTLDAEQVWTSIVGETSASYVVSPANTYNTGYYKVVASNVGGSTDSETLAVYIYTIPILTISPPYCPLNTVAELSVTNTTEGYTYYLCKDDVLITNDYITLDVTTGFTNTIYCNNYGTFSYKVSIVRYTTDPTLADIFSAPVSLTVYPKPVIHAESDVMIVGQSMALTFQDLDKVNYSYELQSSGNNGESWSVIAWSGDSDSYTIIPTLPGSYDFRLAISVLGGAELGTSDLVRVTVSYWPAIGPISIDTQDYIPSTGEVTAKFSFIQPTFTGVSGIITYKLLLSPTLEEKTSDQISPLYYQTTAFSTLDYYIVAYDANGNQLTEKQGPALHAVIPCLPRGTKVLTPDGYRLVEDFADGDLVVTDDGREVPVKVHHSGTTCSDAKSAPVRIAARSFFGEYPVASIRVSSWHAFKVGPGNAWMLPKDVIGIDGVVQEPFGQAVEYYHFELPNYLRDNLVLEGGAVVESYGIPWKQAAGLWGKPTYVMDKEAGYCRRITDA